MDACVRCGVVDGAYVASAPTHGEISECSTRMRTFFQGACREARTCAQGVNHDRQPGRGIMAK